MSLDLRDPSLSADRVKAELGLLPHPEGGHYRELWRDSPDDGSRGAATSIHFLLAAGERSHWHRVDAVEIWLWQAGAPLMLEMLGRSFTLGPGLTTGQVLQATVPPAVWQASCSLGAWSLVSCIVAPAFRFDGFELAPPGWTPDQG